MSAARSTPLPRRAGLTAALLATLALAAFANADDQKKPRYPKPPSDKGVRLVPEAWLSASGKKLTPAELDALLNAAHKADRVKQAAFISDEAFLRRVYLDLVGATPRPDEVKKFLAVKHPEKRARLVEKLLEHEAFAKLRARNWRDILLAGATENNVLIKFGRDQALEDWLFEQFRENTSWRVIAEKLITVNDVKVSFREPKAGGQAGLMLAHTRQDAVVGRTNDVSRVFLGINLSCAQCHDHPDDVWKRQHFHELAAFFGRTGERFKFTMQPLNLEVTVAGRAFGEYRMPDRDDPAVKTRVQPRFLTGERPGGFASDAARRKALAGYVASKDNYYFAAAFVNRVWGELMGQAFVMPVDNLGPLQAPLYSEVLLRLADSFRASDFDVRELYRLIITSDAYRRQFRQGDTPQEHVKFAGTYPTRLRGDALWASLSRAVGPLPEFGGGGFGMMGVGLGRGGRQPPLRFQFLEQFNFDLSAKPEDVEGSVQQSLMLMNNPQINNQVRAKGNTMLARVLREFPKDGDAVDQVYLRALGRSPSSREKRVCLEHAAGLKDRGAAFEDILWSLINSAEFRTKR